VYVRTSVLDSVHELLQWSRIFATVFLWNPPLGHVFFFKLQYNVWHSQPSENASLCASCSAKAKLCDNPNRYVYQGKRILCSSVPAVEWFTCGLHHGGAHMSMSQLQRISFMYQVLTSATWEGEGQPNINIDTAK
jgi:hypothetical protein